MGSTLDKNLLAEYDNEQLHHLNIHGILPAIVEWDGWHLPTTDDLLCLSMVMKLKEINKGLFSLEGPNWLLFGESPYHHYLMSHPEEIACPALERYCLHIGYSLTNSSASISNNIIAIPGTLVSAANMAAGHTIMVANVTIPEHSSPGLEMNVPVDIEMEEKTSSSTSQGVPEVPMQTNKETPL